MATVIDTNTTVINGRNVQVVTYDDGHVEQVDLGAVGNSEDASAILKNMFTKYGITDLADTIDSFLKQGYSQDRVSVELENTDAYKKRFAANDARIKAGLPVLSPAEYLATERSYRSIMQSAGLPAGFYDSQSDFQKFLENDTSPTELNQRVQAAKSAVANTDPYYTDALQSMYGLSTGDMIAHLLDPERAAPLVERQAKAAEFGAAALRQGLTTNATNAESYAEGTPTGVGAEQGYEQVANILPTMSKLGNIYGDQYTQANAESDVFGGLASAKRKRQKLVQQESDIFSGQSGVAGGSLAASKTGSF